MRKSLSILGVLLGALLLAGCVHPHRHAHVPAKTVAVLDAEHGDGRVVVIHERPAQHRHCWRHRRHWHCRR